MGGSMGRWSHGVVAIAVLSGCAGDGGATSTDASSSSSASSSSTDPSTSSSSSSSDDASDSDGSSSSSTSSESGSGSDSGSDSEGGSGSSSSSSDDGSSSTGADACLIEVASCETPDVGTMPCSTFTQDCGAGQKCILVTGAMGWPDSTTCTPLVDDPKQVGEDCTGGVDYDDDCDAGLTCLDGVCTELCSCSLATPVCDTPNTWCAPYSGGLGGFCMPWCDPLDPTSCTNGEICISLFGQTPFFCANDASGAGGAPGEACGGSPNACDFGGFCAANAAFLDCDANGGCCTSFCTLGDDAACLEGQSCVPWFDEGEAPSACYETLGICAV